MSAPRITSLLFAIVVLSVYVTACAPPETDESTEATARASNKLNWTARTETGVYGYLVYRSEDRAGPFRRIHPGVVRVPADRIDKHAYTFSDEEVTPGVTYYYYLDAVSDAGLKQRFSGIISRTTAEVPDS